MSDKKLLIGPKVRRLRLDQQLTQAQMAADLEISPAYLNLIEANQRPVTAQVLVKLAGAYDIDLPTFARDEGPEIAAALRQAFAAPGLRDHGLGRQDFEDMAKLSPEAVEALLSLAARPAAVVMADTPRPGPALADVLDEAFPALEALAAEVRQSLGPNIDLGLAEACPFKIEILPAAIMGHTLRRYDLHRRRLLLHRALTQAAQRFQIVVQFVLQAYRDALDATMPKGVEPAEARLQAANYVAGALLMPAEQLGLEAGLDLLALAHNLDVTLPQVAQRLARLHPSVLISIDGAGQVFSERGLTAFPEWRGVLGCPDWAIYGLEGAEIARQQVVLPSGAGFDCHIFASRLRSVGQGQSFPRRTYALALPMETAAEGATRLHEGPYHGLNDIYRRDLRPYAA